METKSRLRREQDILDRLENVKRLIQMEETILTANGCRWYASYHRVDREGKKKARICLMSYGTRYSYSF